MIFFTIQLLSNERWYSLLVSYYYMYYNVNIQLQIFVQKDSDVWKITKLLNVYLDRTVRVCTKIITDQIY